MGGRVKRLGLREIGEVYRLLSDMRELRDDPPQQRRVMVEGLVRLVGARQGSSVRLSGWAPAGELRLIDVEHGGWRSPEGVKLWEQAVLVNRPRLDVLIDAATKVAVGGGRTMLREELVGDGALPVAYHELARVAGVSHELMAWWPAWGQEAAPARVDGVTLHRGWGERRFGRREREVLRLFNAELGAWWREGRMTPRASGAACAGLPPRLAGVLGCLLEGMSVKETAVQLGLQYRTVDGYVKELYRRLGVHSRGELLAKWVRR